MSALTLARPWLEFDLGALMPVLSWSVNRPGLVQARRILWREVRNADLPCDLDVDAWLEAELRARNALDAVTLLTSRDIRLFTQAQAREGEVTAHAIATVGLSNAERVGHRVDRTGHDWGTINVAVKVEAGLTEAARLELMSIVTQARTAAVMEVRWPLPSGIATGTGTDCLAIAAPAGDTRYAGLHTDVGVAAGRAAFEAVLQGAQDWLKTYAPEF